MQRKDKKKKKKKKNKTPVINTRFFKKTLPFRTIGQEDHTKKWAERRIVGELYFTFFFILA